MKTLNDLIKYIPYDMDIVIVKNNKDEEICNFYNNNYTDKIHGQAVFALLKTLPELGDKEVIYLECTFSDVADQLDIKLDTDMKSIFNFNGPVWNY